MADSKQAKVDGIKELGQQMRDYAKNVQPTEYNQMSGQKTVFSAEQKAEWSQLGAQMQTLVRELAIELKTEGADVNAYMNDNGVADVLRSL